ncbi:hypothetical protein DERP_014867 [Dermatophagoides pteronyssinus]|uniref:Uncharacterized protein n=1 Tax=Dermatophagoides pteronyssinus TaxID=6956 RepID=A0ABQ8J4M6_DERPT|nr:hypothetical protein DERP_014867 [Dermatophagoides pteronyssinus]
MQLTSSSIDQTSLVYSIWKKKISKLKKIPVIMHRPGSSGVIEKKQRKSDLHHWLLVKKNKKFIYFNGIKRDECVAPIPGRPCLTANNAIGLRFIPRDNLRLARAGNNSIKSLLDLSNNCSRSTPRYEYFLNVLFFGT